MKFLVNWTIDLTKLPTYRKFRGEFSEELDQQLLLQLSQKKKDYHKDTLKDLKNEILYQMKKDNTNTHVTKYKQSYKLGRFYANTITNFQKKLKHTLFHYLGWKDIDMQRGHPSLIINLGRLNNIIFTYISSYVENTQKQFDEMTDWYGDELQDHQKKWLFNLMIYGGAHSTWIKRLIDPPESDLKKGYKPIILKTHNPRPFEISFKAECDKIKNLVWKNNPKLIEIISKKDLSNQEEQGDTEDEDADENQTPEYKLKNRCISYFLQILENECLYHLYEFLTKKGYMYPKHCCLEKDGICFKPLIEFDNYNLCLDANEYTRKMTKFDITWKIKPYENCNIDFVAVEVRQLTDLGLGQDDDDDYGLNDVHEKKYAEMKEEFEETHFKIKDCDLFLFKNKREIKHFKDSDLKNSYKQLCYGYGKKNDEVYGWIEDKSKPLSFIERWVKDEHIKTYDDIGIYPPPLTTPENHFNTWTGFPLENCEDEYIHDEKALQEILHFLKILCRHDEDVFQFLLKWVANLIQYPAEKNGLFPIFVSDEGIGKGTFCKILEKLVGEDKFLETTAPEKDVWGKFNSLMVGSYLVYINEFGKKNQEEADGRIKGLLTDGNLTIECKGKDPYKFKSYHRFIRSTNSEDPTFVKKGNRRKWIIRCSDELKGNKERFNRLYDLLDDSNVIRTLFEYLMSIDCRNMLGDDLPKTDYQEILEESNENIMDSFLKWSISDIYFHGDDLDLKDCEGIYVHISQIEGVGEIKYKSSTLFAKFGRFKDFMKIRTYDMNNFCFSKKIFTYSYNLKNNFITRARDSINSYIIIDWNKAKQHYEINDYDINKSEM